MFLPASIGLLDLTDKNLRYISLPLSRAACEDDCCIAARLGIICREERRRFFLYFISNFSGSASFYWILADTAAAAVQLICKSNDWQRAFLGARNSVRERHVVYSLL